MLFYPVPKKNCLAIFLKNSQFSWHQKLPVDKKSSAPGMDLEFENDGIYHVVSIKSLVLIGVIVSTTRDV